MFQPEKAPRPLTADLSAIIDAALAAKSKADYTASRGSGVGDVAKKRIGSGYIGLSCERQLGYKYHKAEVEPRENPIVSPAELQRHADSGHWFEEKAAEWLRLAGFNLLTKNEKTGKQFGYLACRDPETGQARMAGELDGVILSGPYDLPYPVLWECKKATEKKFNKFVAGGVKAADDKYYGQLQHNHVMMEVHNTLFTMMNLNTMKFYFELVTLDVQRAQELNNRAARVISSQCAEELPRIAASRDNFNCRFCDYAERCWTVPARPAATMAAPNWL